MYHEGVDTEDEVEVFRCVIGQNGELTHSGDYVKLSSGHYEIKYGLLLLCCKTSNGSKLCVMRGLESILSLHGAPIMNELECPLLTLTHSVFTVKSSAILKAVSVVHACGNSCQFVMKQRTRRIEREDLHLSSRLEYDHDYAGNYMYYLNVYCMNS